MINAMIDKLKVGAYREVAMAMLDMTSETREELFANIRLTVRPILASGMLRRLQEEFCFAQRELDKPTIVEIVEAETKTYKFCKWCFAETVHINGNCVHCSETI